MPPIRKYEYQDNSNVSVIIIAYSEDEALNRLERTVKNPNSFTLIKINDRSI